jgi:ABC-type transporter Mla subunit MlaD
MADSVTAGARDPFENLISIVAGPIAAVIRSFDQLRRGSDELIKGLENFNRTTQTLNDTAERVNALLNEFEEPARTILPQVMRTVNLAEALADKVSGPVDQVVPGLTRLADTLNSPVLTSLPTDLAGFVDALNDLVRRLAPLGQLAESATGLFGLRIPGMSRSSTTPVPVLTPAAEPPSAPSPKPAASAKRTAPAKRKAQAKRKAPARKKTSAKKSSAKQPPAE